MPTRNEMLVRASVFIPLIADSLAWVSDEDDDHDDLLQPPLLQCLAILHSVMMTTMTRLPRTDSKVARLCMSSTRSRPRTTWTGKVVSCSARLNRSGMLADCVTCVGREDAFITRALLAQLAQRLHGHQQIVLGGGGGGGEEDEDGEATILLNNDEGCNVM